MPNGSTGYKPDSYPSVSVYLVCQDALALADFLAQVFGTRPARRIDNDDGAVRHLEVWIDDTIVMIGQPQGAFTPSPALIHVYVKDVDAAYGRALNLGAHKHHEPAHMPGDTDRRGGFVDPFGNTWFVATQVTHEH